MLWVGWYGFNAGSALGADGIAATAFTRDDPLAAAAGSFTWGVLEYMTKRHASILGFCSGAVGGLVVITPACGFVTPAGAVLIGVLAGVVPFLFCTKVKAMFGYDDALDTFGVHAVGGTLGALLTGFLATARVNPNLSASNAAAKANGLAAYVSNGTLWEEQLKAMVITIAFAVVSTTILAYGIKALMGLRPAPEVERQGLDITDHGEEGYIL